MSVPFEIITNIQYQDFSTRNYFEGLSVYFYRVVSRLLLCKTDPDSLHLLSLSWKSLNRDCLERVSTAAWMLLGWPYSCTSEIVVSSTYFHIDTPWTLRSLDIIMKSHRPNFVRWGTPAGTEDHSEWQSFASLTRCLRFIRKSMIHHTFGCHTLTISVLRCCDL